ncbi:MAG: type II secretion system protein [Candidatus Peregrinibacteria bacterium]
MKKCIIHMRPGTTLVELLLFLAFFAVVGGTVISILFATSDQRARQQTIASVERVGLQTLQGLRWRIEHAERIMDPASGSTGSILTLQMVSEYDDPFVVGVESGSLVLVLRETKQVLTPAGMTISGFTARNSSPNDDHPTLLLSFDLAETYPLPSTAVPQYARHFEMAVQLLPKDQPTGNACGCPAPTCQGGTYIWNVCSGDDCGVASVALPCSQ